MLIELIKINGKVYRPYTYEEAKVKLLGSKLEFVDPDCDGCCECEDPMDPDQVCPIESYLVTEVSPEFFVVKGSRVPYLFALQLFHFIDGSPVGIEVELKDKVAKATEEKKSKPNKKATEEKKSKSNKDVSKTTKA